MRREDLYTMETILNEQQIERYSRQMMIFGVEGQEKLLNAKVLVIGAGGLGSCCLFYLTSAGIGKIGIVDNDCIELHNLNRQILYTTAERNIAKVNSAKDKLRRLNPDSQITTYHTRLTKNNIDEILTGYDIVIDCSDNIYTKYLLNDFCVVNKKALFYASVINYDGQVMTILPEKTACYRCIFPNSLNYRIETCNEMGVIGAVVGIVGSIQANEVLKYILGLEALLINQILIVDALTLNIQRMKIKPNPNCPVCVSNNA